VNSLAKRLKLGMLLLPITWLYPWFSSMMMITCEKTGTPSDVTPVVGVSAGFGVLVGPVIGSARPGGFPEFPDGGGGVVVAFEVPPVVAPVQPLIRRTKITNPERMKNE
jgi:hypothetical protein